VPSEEGHIHWTGSADDTVTYLGQELQMTSELSNMATTAVAKQDPIGSIRLRVNGSSLTGLRIPTDGWEDVPGSDPVLQARADGYYPIGYIRIRLA
jgi:hypothetical protein